VESGTPAWVLAEQPLAATQDALVLLCAEGLKSSPAHGSNAWLVSGQTNAAHSPQLLADGKMTNQEERDARHGWAYESLVLRHLQWSHYYWVLQLASLLASRGTFL